MIHVLSKHDNNLDDTLKCHISTDAKAKQITKGSFYNSPIEDRQNQ